MSIDKETWEDQLVNTATALAAALLSDAKQSAKTYEDAEIYIKKASQTWVSVSVRDKSGNAAAQINRAVCQLALNQLYEEEKKQPIVRGEQ